MSNDLWGETLPLTYQVFRALGNMDTIIEKGLPRIVGGRELRKEVLNEVSESLSGFRAPEDI